MPPALPTPHGRPPVNNALLLGAATSRAAVLPLCNKLPDHPMLSQTGDPNKNPYLQEDVCCVCVCVAGPLSSFSHLMHLISREIHRGTLRHPDVLALASASS